MCVRCVLEKNERERRGRRGHASRQHAPVRRPHNSNTAPTLFNVVAATAALNLVGDGKGALLTLYLGRWVLVAAATAALAAARSVHPTAAATAGAVVAGAGAAVSAAATAAFPTTAIAPVSYCVFGGTMVVPAAVAAAISRAAPAADVVVTVTRALGVIVAGWLLAASCEASRDADAAWWVALVEGPAMAVPPQLPPPPPRPATTSPLALPPPSHTHDTAPSCSWPATTITSLRTTLADAEDRASSLAASHARVTASLRATQRRLTDTQARHDALLTSVGSAPYTPPRLHAALSAAVEALLSARTELAAADARLASRDHTLDGLRRAVASARAAAAHARLSGGGKVGASLEDVISAAVAPGEGMTADERAAAAEGGWHGALRDAGEDAEGSGCE